MKVLIGVDPHKASVAVAAVDEAKGELLERASFPQNRSGLRALERWAKRFPERRPKRWRTPAASGSVPGGEVGGGRRVGGGRAAQTLGKGSGAIDRQLPQERRPRCPGHRLGRLAQRAAGGGRSRDSIRDAAPTFREALIDLVAERTRGLKAACTHSCEISSPAG